MGRPNSYDFIRFCAAFGVLVGHQFIISDTGPPWGIDNQDIAEIPLHVFFCLSGFLIYQSLERSTDSGAFLAARMTRILPTLIVALAVTSLATLIWFQNGAHAIDHLKYVYRNIFFSVRIISDFIPGVFEANSLHTLNSPLWTLAYEVWCYAALFAIFLFAKSARVPLILMALLILNLCWVSFGVNDNLIPYTPLFPMRIGRLGCFFFSGAMVAACWHIIERRSGLYGVASLTAAPFAILLFPHSVVTAMLTSLVVVCLGSASLLSFYGKGGDPSYGMYVFAWPIQQFSVIFISGFWLSLGAASAATIATAYLTWHLYEKRVIRRRIKLAALIKSALIYLRHVVRTHGYPRRVVEKRLPLGRDAS